MRRIVSLHGLVQYLLGLLLARPHTYMTIAVEILQVDVLLIATDALLETIIDAAASEVCKHVARQLLRLHGIILRRYSTVSFQRALRKLGALPELPLLISLEFAGPDLRVSRGHAILVRSVVVVAILGAGKALASNTAHGTAYSLA